ncbi:hypothetical protein [Pengzhenrongella frigida]|uniref:Uncharacterized protein n=1 Tax=Pengzhenrongella frigida TaxID=1259133 RepID=A0A4Q5N1E6_9MICO|nr:hypothetical protein [Cellulomonas sp. HLT2-17]RYV51928.1 hypothetical protein EUA98_05890 [Cellulomonas sp. HLT2-17]
MRSLFSIVRSHPKVAVAATALGPVAVFVYFWVYGRGAWSPKEALTETLPGDDLLLPDDRFMRLQEEVIIDAPIETVWPVVAQLGQRKGGFYALAWLERLCTFHIYNTFDAVDEWQEINPGDFLFYHQSGIGSQIAQVEPGRYFTSLSDTRRPPTAQGGMALKPPFGLTSFAWTWNFVLQELPDGRTRFVNRCDATWEPFTQLMPKWLTIIVLGSPSVFMVRSMLEKVKQVAEGRQPASRLDLVVRALGVWSDQARPRPLA